MSKFMVYIEDTALPRKKHDCRTEADFELHRVMLQNKNVGKTGYVLEIKTCMKSEIKTSFCNII